MNSEREVHAKEFMTQMFTGCSQECFASNSFGNANLTAAEAKCLKTCFVATAKRLEAAGAAMGLEAKLNHSFA